jgi:Vitamin K-dependent gamma-carboxylase
VLAQGAMLWDYRELLLDESGLVPWVLDEALIDPLMPRLSAIAALLAPMGVSSRQTVTIAMGVHLLAATGLLVGFGTRACAFVAWITHLALIGTGEVYTYGLGKMLVIALFYCLVMPVGREWSVDRSMRRRAAGESRGDDATLSVLVLRLHLCIIYAAAGISKAVGGQWWSGEAVWRALSLPQFQQFDPSPLGAYPFVLQVLALGSVAVQLGYPVLVWTRLRVAIVILSELLHLGIAVFLGLWLFSGIMIALNAAAFGESIWQMFTAKIPGARPVLVEKQS